MVDRIFLGLSALLWLAFGIGYFFVPGYLAGEDYAGVVAATATGKTELRAMYGGLELPAAAVDVTDKRIAVVVDQTALPQGARRGRQPIQVAVPHRRRSRTVHVHVPSTLNGSYRDHVGPNPKGLTMGRNVFGRDQWGACSDWG